MKSRRLTAIAVLAVSGTLVAGPAGAVSISIAASTGHSAIGGFQADTFDTDNNWVCADGANFVGAYWYTPLVLHNKPSGTVTLTQWLENVTTFGKSKGYSFLFNGAYYSSTGNWTASSAVGNLSIPSNGTAILDTWLLHRQFYGNDCLHSLKVEWT